MFYHSADRFVQEEDEGVATPNITDIELAIGRARGLYPQRYTRVRSYLGTQNFDPDS